MAIFRSPRRVQVQDQPVQPVDEEVAPDPHQPYRDRMQRMGQVTNYLRALRGLGSSVEVKGKHYTLREIDDTIAFTEETLAKKNDPVAGAILSPGHELRLISHLVDLRRARAKCFDQGLLDNLEPGFVQNAVEFSKQHDIRYQAWLIYGVPKAVLDKSGIKPD